MRIKTSRLMDFGSRDYTALLTTDLRLPGRHHIVHIKLIELKTYIAAAISRRIIISF